MRRILVTAISGDIANGILKILQDEDNILYGCDVNNVAVGMDLVEDFWQCKYAMEDGYLEELLERCIDYGVTHLIPVNEREIEVIGNAREIFENRGIRLVLQSSNILRICLDKYETIAFLRENGHAFEVPETYLDLKDVRDRGKKYICKPRKSNGSKNIFLYEFDKNSGDDFLLKDYVVQEYIDSEEEYTVGVFRQDKVTNVIAFQRKLKNGYSSEVELSHDARFAQIAKEIADLFDLKGYLNIQLRKKGGRYFVFEINPRISGTVRFRHMLGYTDVLWWLDLMDGKCVPPYQCGYRRALGVRELNEKYLILE